MTAATPAAAAVRLSSVLNSCPRKAVYEAVGAPARERSDREERILFRGRTIGRDYADLMAAKHGEANIERERKVNWPLGVGHIDVYLRRQRQAIEVLSSVHARGVNDQTHGKLLQLVGYMEHDPDVDAGALVILNPSTFEEELIPVSKSSRTYGELVNEMRDRVGQVTKWRDTGDLPARVCEKPGDAWGRFCLHADHCFTDWVEPELEERVEDETFVASLADFAAVADEHRRANKAASELERRKKELQAVLEQAELPVGETRVGPFKVKRTWTQRQPTFDWAKAELAGVFEPGLYSDFFRDGASYSTFKAERVDVTGSEFGDEAPWTDEDILG